MINLWHLPTYLPFLYQELSLCIVFSAFVFLYFVVFNMSIKLCWKLSFFVCLCAMSSPKYVQNILWCNSSKLNVINTGWPNAKGLFYPQGYRNQTGHQRNTNYMVPSLRSNFHLFIKFNLWLFQLYEWGDIVLRKPLPYQQTPAVGCLRLEFLCCRGPQQYWIKRGWKAWW